MFPFISINVPFQGQKILPFGEKMAQVLQLIARLYVNLPFVENIIHLIKSKRQ